MNVRVPLLGKILAWFFLNLLVLAAVFYGVFHAQLRLGLDSLLAGRAGDRIRAVSELAVAELRDRPAGEWDGVLKNFGSAYKVAFYVFRNDGVQAAGPDVALPESAAARVVERRPGEGMGMGWGPRLGRGPRHGPEASLAAPQPVFMVRGGDPKRYWTGVRLPLMDQSQARPCPLILVLASDSLAAGGLFFDATPWVAAGLGTLVFSVLFWVPLVRSVTRSISEMTRAAEQISEGRFDARVDEKRRDELGRLGFAINRMAGRLSGFVTGQKRFLGDTAHELCSPVARMQVALGILEERVGPEHKARVADVREEVEHISSLVNELLSFSKAGLGRKEIQLAPVDVAALARRIIDRETPEGRTVALDAPEPLLAMAEPELLARALGNLLRNSLRYAGESGPVTISIRARDGQVFLAVADQGPGVPEECLQQIFDPFYRTETSRSRELGGAGLGLAIVKSCVEACHGTVAARNRQPSGLIVEMVFKSA